MGSKVGLVRDEAARREWALKRPWCAFCGVAYYETGFPGLSVHHLIGASGRSDEPCNQLVTCGRCHSLIHGAKVLNEQGGYLPNLTLGMVLTCKRLRDPGEYDAARLAELRGQALSAREPLPDFLVNEYARRRPRDESAGKVIAIDD